MDNSLEREARRIKTDYLHVAVVCRVLWECTAIPLHGRFAFMEIGTIDFTGLWRGSVAERGHSRIKAVVGAGFPHFEKTDDDDSLPR